MKDFYPYLLGAMIGCCLLVFVIGGVASLEDGNLADKCDFYGKVKLNGHAYACKRISDATSINKGIEP